MEKLPVVNSYLYIFNTLAAVLHLYPWANIF